MKLNVFKFLTILIFLAEAHGLEVQKVKNKFFLSDSTCERPIETVGHLEKWGQSTLKSMKACDLKKLQTFEDEKTGDCKVDISNCLPDHVLKFQGISPENSGPNCWNLALVMKGILPNLRYTPPEEMAYYMRPPLCRQISNHEKKIPGDVGAIRLSQPEGVQEYHGFIYISDDLAYSKNGFSKMSPYSLQPLENVLKIYNVSKEKECRRNEIDTQSNCKVATSYFRCISMEEYLASHSDIPKEISMALKQMHVFERCLERQTFTNQILAKEATQGLTASLEVLTFYVKKELENKEKIQEAENQFLLGRILLELDGIISQLSENDKTDSTQEIFAFAESFSTALEELQGKK